MSDRVYIFDTTLRDGEQSPGCSMTVPEKLRMAEKLVALGVDIMEAGFQTTAQPEGAADVGLHDLVEGRLKLLGAHGTAHLL